MSLDNLLNNSSDKSPDKSPTKSNDRSSNEPPDDESPAKSEPVSLSEATESLNTPISISDAGIYSLCALTSLLFHELYSEESNKEFCKQTIAALLTHLGLTSNQVKNSMFTMFEGDGYQPESVNDFINLLKDEDLFKSSYVPLIEALILFAIRNGCYDARLRVLILKIADLFNIPSQLIKFYEESVIEMLSNEYTPTESEEQQKEKAKRLRNKKIKKYLLIGSGTLIGGAILGLTGGLVAPYVALGATTIIGAGSAAALGSTTGIAIIGSLFGVAGAGLTGHKMKKRVGDIEEFAFETLNDEGKELHITIAVSGWLSDKGPDAFRLPWKSLQNTREQYCVRYESSYLLELGTALDYFLGFAVSMGVQEALKFTILSGIMAAIAWPATLVTFSSVIDNPWSVTIRRTAEIGRHLAEVLINREHGQRPVTLIGFSLGARVIFFCLLELSQRENSEGIVQDAILLGAPVSGSLEYWRKFNKVVSGRLVNGYCGGDWLLKFLYRTTNTSIRIAGLNPIDWKDRRLENVDLSDIVNGHLDYYKKLPEVLKKIGVQVNENELGKSDSLMKKSKTVLPTDMKAMTEPSYCSIRMSISEPNFLKKEETKPELNLSLPTAKLERSLSLEDILIKSKKSKMRLSSTFADFKKESQQLKESQKSSFDASINDALSIDKSIDNSIDQSTDSSDSAKVTNLSNSKSSSNDSINGSKPLNKYLRLSRFNLLSRFSRRNEIVEEESNQESNSAPLKDELTKVEDDKLMKMNSDIIQDTIIKNEKQKNELNKKIKDELKVEIDNKIKDKNLKNELKDNMKINDFDIEMSTLKKPIKRNDAEFLQLNVENLNLKNDLNLKRI